jgi:hypothetical protein
MNGNIDSGGSMISETKEVTTVVKAAPRLRRNQYKHFQF